jgi:hypothetical protein
MMSACHFSKWIRRKLPQNKLFTVSKVALSAKDGCWPPAASFLSILPGGESAVVVVVAFNERGEQARHKDRDNLTRLGTSCMCPTSCGPQRNDP